MTFYPLDGHSPSPRAFVSYYNVQFSLLVQAEYDESHGLRSTGRNYCTSQECCHIRNTTNDLRDYRPTTKSDYKAIMAGQRGKCPQTVSQRKPVSFLFYRLFPSHLWSYSNRGKPNFSHNTSNLYQSLEFSNMRKARKPAKTMTGKV